MGRFNTKWSLGQPNASQAAMLQQGYHFLPAFNTGFAMRTNGLTSVSASTSKQDDPHSCIDTVCALNTNAILSDVQGAQYALGGGTGNYYSVGNEVDDTYSDDVSPAVYGGQFDAWVNAIKQGDPTARIVAPSISSVSCCQTSSTQPFGTAGQWFQAFVTDYEQAHKGARPPIDVLAMHLFNFDPSTAQTTTAQVDNYLSEVQKFRREADSLGYAGVPIWITEMGFYYYPGSRQPLTQAQSSQVTRVLSELAANASALDLQRLFLFTANDSISIDNGVHPLYDPAANSSPSTPMPLTDYGQIVANLAGGSK